jgi:uroporphyrinogen-III synthase
MKVLVTRPLEDAENTARQLAARGHQALLAPLLATQFTEGDPVSLDGVQAILATSANSVRALARRTDRRDVPLFAVGPQTAAAAEAAGFLHIRNADGDARALALATSRWARPESGALLHVHGGQGAGALAAGLRGQGFSVREEVLYAVEPQPFMPEAIAALRAADAALFYSPRSAAVFREHVCREGLPTAGLIAICISPATAASLEDLPFRALLTATAPNQEALLACLDQCNS